MATLVGVLATPAASADPRIGVHYQLNGSSLEARGLGKGTLQGFGADPFVPGRIGSKALRFSSVGQAVALPSFYSNGGHRDVSVSVWVKTVVGTDQVIVSYDTDKFWQLGIDGPVAGPGQIGFSVQTNAGLRELASTTPVNDGLWHHVLAVFNGYGESMQIFIDGTLDADLAVPGSTSFGTGEKRFGYLGVGSKAPELGGETGPHQWFRGDLDDVRVYSSAITPAQVNAIFTEDPSPAADATRAPADTDADGIANEWEVLHGLDPNNPADADTQTPDAEGAAIGATYLQQYRAGADPSVDNDYTPPSPMPVVGVEVVTADAYELEGTVGVFRITATGGSGPAVPVFFTLGTSSDPGEGHSDPSDYEVTDAADNPLEGFIMLNPAGGSADVRIHPVQDTTAEYPEVVELTIDSSSDYVRGGLSSGRCLIMDATDIPENVTTFKAVFTPERGAATTASGFATLTINGPKTEASFYSTYGGLSSTQTNQHIHHVAESAPGVPNFNAGGPVIEPLSMTDPHDGVAAPLHTWTIRDTGGYSAQDLVDSLFRQNGLSLYCNVHTLNNGGGEIWGFLEEFTGAVALSAEETAAYESAAGAASLPAGAALLRDVARFLTQTTWGPRMADINALYTEITTNPVYDKGDGTYDQLAAYQQWMTDQLALDQTRLYDYVWALDEYEFHGHRFARTGGEDGEGATRRLNPVQGYEPQATNFEGSMWTLFCYSHDQFRQRIALAFSEIWVISRLEGTVNSRHYGAASYWDALADHADGEWRDLIEYVSKSPMMGQYLSHLKNQTIKDTGGNILVFPDENYAREIQQLFSIGLLELLPDGRVRLGGDGQPIQTYTNTDIENLARVFTGWSFSQYETNSGDVVNNTNFNQGSGNRYLPQLQWTSPMKCFDASIGQNRHDTDEKVYLGQTFPAGQNGQQDLDQALDLLMAHPNTAPFLSSLLIKRFTTSNPSPAYVYRVANVFNGGTNHQSGSGMVDAGGTFGDMEKVIRAIILDPEVRDLEIADNRIDAGKSKEPALVVAHAIRALNAQSRIPLEILTRLESGPDYTVNPGSGNLIPLPVTGEDGAWPAQDYPSDQFDNFPPDASIIHFTSRTPTFGQSPMSAPSVFNFFLPDYSPGGGLGIAGLSAPELQLATETQVVDAVNYTENLVHTPGYIDATGLEGFANADDYVRADFSEYVAAYNGASGTVVDKAEALVDYLDLVFAAGALKADYGSDPSPENPRQYVINTVLNTNEGTLEKVKNALYLIVHSPAGLSQR
ncbi:DUF1800 family protein [Haloferula helveola]|uniref:DUF1800 family protein n=1 Tax=Haloferula helveola TaxID=490095 RepID=UPI0030CAEBF7